MKNKCICGYEFERDEDIPVEYDRCSNCNRNIYDIHAGNHTKKLETALNEWLFDLETYGAAFVESNTHNYKIKFKRLLEP